jgi:hypothetical protein
MVTKKSWQEFRQSGLFWLVNTTLHMFGWALVMNIDQETQEITEVYPARVKFRGFDEESNTEGYIKVSQYMKDHSGELLQEAKE